MKKTPIKNFADLLEKENHKAGDLKRMVERYGVYHYNDFLEWEAAPIGEGNSEQVIDNAISALKQYSQIWDGRYKHEAAPHFYEHPEEYDVYRYGFMQDEHGNFFVENTHIQTLEEQIERLKEENRRLGGNYKPSLDKGLIARHLELANQIYREALDKLDPKTNRIGSRTPKKWMEFRLAGMGLDLSDSMIKTIATVANWSPEQTNKPKN